jgi:hypothetical protein
MRTTSSAPSERIRAQSAELLNLADAIDLHARLQQTRLIAGRGRNLLATHELSDQASMPVEDYSDLLPNPPQDPTAWRGAQFRRLRNAATTGDDDTAGSASAGHGRRAPE